MSFLGLPPISQELKSITPYLQRADELKSQDPVVTYWCAYYAAQVGIALKAKDNSSRDTLFALLGTLERLKKEIGPNDAVDLESASSAYVENFALKVFSLADNEDRRGNPNRSTAKKFLAAANFLEVLKIFPKSEVSDSNEEKIRYAKWKAADIAKAFREGRKPTPGPAGSSLPESNLASITSESPPRPSNVVPRNSPLRSSSRSPPRVKRSSPPTHVDVARANDHPQFQPQPQTPPGLMNFDHHRHLGGWAGEGEATPGSWSTAATPGTGHVGPTEWEQPSPTDLPAETWRQKPRSGSGSSAGSGSGMLRHADDGGWPSIDQPRYSPPGREAPGSAGTTSSEGSKKSVRFTPSVTGGVSSTGGTPMSHLHNEPNVWPIPPQLHTSPPINAIDPNTLPPGFVPHPSSHQPMQGRTATPPTTRVSPSSSQHQTYDAPLEPTEIPLPPVQPSHPVLSNYRQPSPPAPVIFTPPVTELTPSIIAKAQKHCRFAISALDYEDAEQARKELRAALAVLGG